MENTQTQPIPVSETTPVVAEAPVVPAPVEPVAPVPSNKKFDPKAILAKVKAPKIPKKIVLIAAGIVVLVLVLVVAGSLLSSRNGAGTDPSPTPATTPTETPISELPSQYADDPDVAEIKADMDKLDQDLDAAAFRDDALRSPSLDWAVKFD